METLSHRLPEAVGADELKAALECDVVLLLAPPVENSKKKGSLQGSATSHLSCVSVVVRPSAAMCSTGEATTSMLSILRFSNPS